MAIIHPTTQLPAAIRELGSDEERVSVNGGAIALDHTGAKLTVQALQELARQSKELALSHDARGRDRRCRTCQLIRDEA